jgi:hypothetical protein
MTGPRRTTHQKSDLGGVRSSDGFTRCTRIVGRLLLWGCVLLLLIRGALSILSTPDTRAVTTTRGVTVTVTQPAHTETSQAQRK